MDTIFRVKYIARKSLLTFFGPADLDEDRDPRVALERARDERLGSRPAKVTKIHIPKRHFHSNHVAA